MSVMNLFLSLGLFFLGYFMVGFGIATIATNMGRLGNDKEKIKEIFPAIVACWPIAIIVEIGILLTIACGAWIDYLFRPRN